MKEVLHIRNFGPIKDVKLELGKVNVLIGDQGTGKSTVAKLYSVIRLSSFVEIFDQNGNDVIAKDEDSAFLEYLDWFGIKGYLNDDTAIKYSSKEFNFTFKNKKIESKEINSHGVERLSMSAVVANDIFIPTERIYLSALANSVYSLMEVKAEMPQVYLRFGNKYNKARTKSSIFDFSELVDVSYSNNEGVDKITIRGGKEVLLKHSSSAIQGLVPMLTVFLNSGMKNSDQVMIPLCVIEEPELNLFPETQYKLVKYILAENNNKLLYAKNRNELLLTTHSPYILASLNNLMYAYTVGQQNRKEVSEIIEEKYWLNPDDVRAYMLVYDDNVGGCIQKNILDEEGKLIDSVQIDQVSTTLNDEFNKLLAIELQK